jgi:hypothetical protein
MTHQQADRFPCVLGRQCTRGLTGGQKGKLCLVDLKPDAAQARVRGGALPACFTRGDQADRRAQQIGGTK